MQEVDSAEFGLWMAEYNIEPWGDRRGDLQAGIIASVAHNVWVSNKSQLKSPLDFIPKFEGDEVNADDLAIQFMKLTLQHGGKIN